MSPDPETMPYPKAGLATSAGAEVVSVESISVLDPSSEEWKDLRASLSKSFLEAEGTAIDESWWWFFVSATRYRLDPGIRTEALYRSPDVVPGRHVFYFEASRRHPGVIDPKCDLVTYASGWVRDPKGKREVRTEAVLTECHRREARFMLPLAQVRVYRGRPLWIVQWSTWQAEWYSVIDVTNTLGPSPLFETWGGGCSDEGMGTEWSWN